MGLVVSLRLQGSGENKSVVHKSSVKLSLGCQFGGNLFRVLSIKQNVNSLQMRQTLFYDNNSHSLCSNLCNAVEHILPISIDC